MCRDHLRAMAIVRTFRVSTPHVWTPKLVEKCACLICILTASASRLRQLASRPRVGGRTGPSSSSISSTNSAGSRRRRNDRASIRLDRHGLCGNLVDTRRPKGLSRRLTDCVPSTCRAERKWRRPRREVNATDSRPCQRPSLAGSGHEQPRHCFGERQRCESL